MGNYYYGVGACVFLHSYLFLRVCVCPRVCACACMCACKCEWVGAWEE